MAGKVLTNELNDMKRRFCGKVKGFCACIRNLFGREATASDGVDGVLIYPECGMSDTKAQALSDLYRRLVRCIEERKLYLDPNISMSQVSRIVGSNRTYVSNVLAPKKGYKHFMNEFRLKYIALQLDSPEVEKESCLIGEDYGKLPSSTLSSIVLNAGFSDMRTFRRALSASDGEWARKIRGRIY